MRGAEYVMLSVADRTQARPVTQPTTKALVWLRALPALCLGVAHAEEFSGKAVAVAALLANDRVTGAVWGRRQAWNFPFEGEAKGGKFV